MIPFPVRGEDVMSTNRVGLWRRNECVILSVYSQISWIAFISGTSDNPASSSRMRFTPVTTFQISPFYLTNTSSTEDEAEVFWNRRGFTIDGDSLAEGKSIRLEELDFRLVLVSSVEEATACKLQIPSGWNWATEINLIVLLEYFRHKTWK